MKKKMKKKKRIVCLTLALMLTLYVARPWFLMVFAPRSITYVVRGTEHPLTEEERGKVYEVLHGRLMGHPWICNCLVDNKFMYGAEKMKKGTYLAVESLFGYTYRVYVDLFDNLRVMSGPLNSYAFRSPRDPAVREVYELLAEKELEVWRREAWANLGYDDVEAKIVREDEYTYMDVETGLFGLIDSGNRPRTEAIYDFIGPLSEYKAWAGMDDLYGVIDWEGKTVIPFEYPVWGSVFHGGVSEIVWDQGDGSAQRRTFINTNNQVLLEETGGWTEWQEDELIYCADDLTRVEVYRAQYGNLTRETAEELEGRTFMIGVPLYSSRDDTIFLGMDIRAVHFTGGGFEVTDWQAE